MRHQFYNRRKILILPELSPAEKILERKLLKKRYELISDGVDKSVLSTKNLKPFKNCEEVDCSLLNQFTIALLNCRSVLNFEKRLKLTNLISQKLPDILCLTETWLDKNFKSYILLSNHYFLAPRMDRKNGTHGGTATICKSNVYFSNVKVNVDFACCVKVSLHHRLLILCFYNPPQESRYRVSSKILINFLSDIISRYPDHRIPVLGDFNEPGIDWDALTSKLPETRALIEFFVNNNYRQLVNEGTHKSGNILDLAFTNIDELFYQDSESFFIEFSDNKYLCFQLPDYRLISEETSSKPRLQKYFYGDLSFDLVTSAFSAFENIDPPCYINHWFLRFNDFFNYAKCKRKKRLFYPSFYTSHTIHALNKRNIFCRRQLKNENICYLPRLDKNCQDSFELDTAIYIENFFS